MKHQKFKIKKGDTVVVLAGKDKGKKGKVLEIFSKTGAAVVERVNVAKRHQKPTKNFRGGIIEKALPIFISKLMLVCPRCSEPTRVKSKELEGRLIRSCGRCSEMIDKV
ncbi:MAG: 50S ribosomal protein L24 [Candidatus Margulisbacteria bacterium]|nr:50S ribosomal protein L24 [Candidatus Margulisiibacteriota bacterium]